MLVSMAIMVPPGLGKDCRVHLLDGFRVALVGQDGEYVLGPGREEGRGLPEQDPVLGFLDNQPGAGAPVPPLPDGFRQDDLALGRDGGN